MTPDVQQFAWFAFVAAVSAICCGLAVRMYMADVLAAERVARRQAEVRAEMYKHHRDTLLRVDRNREAD